MMKRGGSKLDPTTNGSTRIRLVQILGLLAFLYLIFVTFEFPFIFKTEESSNLSFQSEIVSLHQRLSDNEENVAEKQAPIQVLNVPLRVVNSNSNSNGNDSAKPQRRMREYKTVSGLIFNWRALDSNEKDGFSALHRSAITAFQHGEKLWGDILSGKVKDDVERANVNRNETCPNALLLNGSEFTKKGKVMVLPCGLTLGSHITVVGKPRVAHVESDPKITQVKSGDQSVMVSQFMMELIGLKTVDGEDPPRILHYNPRLRGDWSGKPVIEQNTCYRQQWGVSVRCDGWISKPEEDTVDGLLKCEKWRRDDDSNNNEQSKARWWLSRFLSRPKKVTVDWPYPFVEDKLFVMTTSAGLEGYHVNVDGRHVTSFPYRTGFSLEDATGLTLKGDIDIHSIFAASLPSSHPSYAPQRHLEMSLRWRAPPLPDDPVELFIGILSAGNHFAERMAVRKSWMQHKLIKSSKVVARFFVALHARNEINVELKKEADFFGDIVMVPYMDNYDLVVVKTVAICEYGVRTVDAKYIMKCDDDTFVRVDAVIKEANKIPRGSSLYVGNINYYHKPLRHGKWAVTYEEWPEEDYPPYANGPGYILSSDVAHYIVSEFEKHKLRLFKMEDVSMGMWVEHFNSTKAVEYVHSLKFCQFGCIEDYFTAHYQSPKQMICLWNKLQQFGRPICCNMR